MRVIVALAVFVAAPAAAQGGDPRPVEPNTAVELALDGAWEQLGPIDGAQGALSLAGRVALDEALELGGGWGARASGQWLRGGASRGALGATPLRAWIGTGGGLGDWRFGLRIEAAAGLALLGAPEADGNGEWLALSLVGEVAARTDLVRPRLSVRAAAAYSGALAWAGIGALRLAVELGPTAWPARPFGVVRGAAATDLGVSAQVGIGVAFEAGGVGWAVTVLGPDAGTARAIEVGVVGRLGI